TTSSPGCGLRSARRGARAVRRTTGRIAGGDRDRTAISQGAAEFENSIRTEPRRSAMDYRQYITIDPKKRGGKPCVRGLRITVYEVLDYLSCMSHAEFLADFPDLT